jgi:hypothetical protein
MSTETRKYVTCDTVLRIRIRDPVLFYPPDPGSGSGIRDGAMVGSGSGIRDKTSRIRNTAVTLPISQGVSTDTRKYLTCDITHISRDEH